MIGIYKITSPTGKVYIGQSINIKHRKTHYKNLSCKQQPRIYNSLIKYGFENHEFEIIEECKIEELDKKEILHKKYVLKEIGWSRVLFCELYDRKGGPKSEKTKNKISQALKGRKISKETRRKISEHPGRGLKLSKANKGNILKNIGLNPKRLMSQRKKIIQLDLKGNVLNGYLSIHEASKEIFGDLKGVSKISNNLNYLSKTCGGFKFKFI